MKGTLIRYCMDGRLVLRITHEHVNGLTSSNLILLRKIQDVKGKGCSQASPPPCIVSGVPEHGADCIAYPRRSPSVLNTMVPRNQLGVEEDNRIWNMGFLDLEQIPIKKSSLEFSLCELRWNFAVITQSSGALHYGTTC
jgi:hypothetical protein